VFSDSLREGLRKRYGRLPSAAFVAIHFNRNNKVEKPISQETARRWMRGDSMPSYKHFYTLALWLALDISKLTEGRPLANQHRIEQSGTLYSCETIRMANWLNNLPIETKSVLIKMIDSLPAG
jgi:hypothetical protein